MAQIVASNKLSRRQKKSLNHTYKEYVVPQIQILKYMGNKRGLLNWLIPLLNKQLKYGDTFLDLFAGTSSVSYALKPKVRVIANDIQEYSSTISRAVLEFNGKITEGDFNKDLAKPYTKNLSKLTDIFGKAVKIEKELLTNNCIEEYLRFCLNVPKYGELVSNDTFKLNYYSQEDFIQTRRDEKTNFPYILFSTYFPNTFFGLQQCMDIDSIRFAIDQVNSKQKRAVYLSCLLYSISNAANSTGHFAEYLNHKSTQTLNLIKKQRRISIPYQFISKLSEFTSLYSQKNWKNEVYNCNYQVLINKLYRNKKLRNVNLIYIDPPYTSAQYSRYYHIPETLIKYDYPYLTSGRLAPTPTKGRYRNDRHQSKFSQTGEVESAFREMFSLLSNKTNATLAVSYSDNSILRPIDKLINIAKEYYEIIDKKNGHTHSAQGSKFTSTGRGNRKIHEYLLICKPKS